MSPSRTGPFTFRIIEREASSMNSTRTFTQYAKVHQTRQHIRDTFQTSLTNIISTYKYLSTLPLRTCSAQNLCHLQKSK